MSQSKVATSLEAQVGALTRTLGDKVATRDVTDIVNSMVNSFRGELELATSRIGGELNELIEFINAARSEIAAIKPNTVSKRDIPTATDELDAIVQHTEVAAGIIMDCADEVTAVAGELEGALAERLQAVATKIFETSSFQDITGQRVTKVVRVLKQIEEKLGNLAKAVGDDRVEEKVVERNQDGVPLDEKELLNGPQLKSVASNQDDIDALFSDF
jgi:chemotaxis protein CheZ